MIEQTIAFYALKIAAIATILLFFLLALSLILQSHKKHFYKKTLFIGILLTTVLPTLFFIGSTIYLNTISVSKGPVHWHADLEVWACGKELDFLNPEGFSNKIGTAVLHEHNDKRIHQEGVVVHMEDASLGNFFKVIGGAMNNQHLSVPTNDGVVSFNNGQSCQDGSQGVLQVFRYGVKDDKYFQEKLTNPASYVMAPYSAVPNGDCIIVEFSEEKEMTDKLCRSYQVSERIGKIKRE